MELGKKKILLFIVILVIIIIIYMALKPEKQEESNQISAKQEEQGQAVGNYVQTLQDGSKLNISEELQQTKTLGELEIINIQLQEKEGITTLLADVINKGDKESAEQKVIVEILDKEGTTIVTLKGTIDKIPAREKVQLNMAVTADVSNAYDFKISKY